jgi:hypothetical protein
MVKNDLFTHDESPENPWYSPEGEAAGRNGHILVSPGTSTSDNDAIDVWMQGPFHAVGILDATLVSTGFGSFREATGAIQMGATLDVARGHSYEPPPGVQFPVIWPADGMIVPLYQHGGEIPNPLTGCPGYAIPSGLPLIVQIGDGSRTPNVTASSFKQGSTALEHCIIDETNYTNPDPLMERTGRLVLDGRDAIVLIPRHPLAPGTTYTASITANGSTYTWSFSVLESTQGAEDTP